MIDWKSAPLEGTACGLHNKFVRVPIRTPEDLFDVLKQRNVLKLLVWEILRRAAPFVHAYAMAPQSGLRRKVFVAAKGTLQFIEVDSLFRGKYNSRGIVCALGNNALVVKMSGKYFAPAVPGSAGTNPGDELATNKMTRFCDVGVSAGTLMILHCNVTRTQRTEHERHTIDRHNSDVARPFNRVETVPNLRSQLDFLSS